MIQMKKGPGGKPSTHPGKPSGGEETTILQKVNNIR